jgi:hypothetical protein
VTATKATSRNGKFTYFITISCRQQCTLTTTAFQAGASL